MAEMSSLPERLLEDQKAALRAQDQARLSVIRMIRSALQNARIAKGSDLAEAEALEVVAREIRQRREALEEVQKAGRQDLVQRQDAELAIALAYLPQQMSREEIAAEAQKVIAELGARGPADRGRVMGRLMPALRGRADGRTVAAVVEELLGR